MQKAFQAEGTASWGAMPWCVQEGGAQRGPAVQGSSRQEADSTGLCWGPVCPLLRGSVFQSEYDEVSLVGQGQYLKNEQEIEWNRLKERKPMLLY